MELRNEVKLEFPSRAENVGLARVSMAAFAGQLDFTLPDLEEIKVAVSEAVTNCIVHAYGDGTGLIRVSATLGDGSLKVTVEDWGRGITDVEQARQPSFSTEPERMGLGFVFMESFMDKVEVDSNPGRGTRVHMWKECPSPESPEIQET